jgi:ribonuclease T
VARVAGLDRYVSVDVETAGPSPDRFALLAIGACQVSDPERTFYVELCPDRSEVVPEALAVSGLSMDRLAARGTPAAQAMADFADWAEDVCRPAAPVFTALNAPFDWMFVATYFDRYLGRNPFGHSALDIKALYMGRYDVPWSATGYAAIATRFGATTTLSHNALADAVDQARLFRAIVADGREAPREERE